MQLGLFACLFNVWLRNCLVFSFLSFLKKSSQNKNKRNPKTQQDLKSSQKYHYCGKTKSLKSIFGHHKV